MTLQERLIADLRNAMKSGDKVRQSTIQLVRAGIKNAEIAKGDSLDDAGVIDILSREVKQRRESIDEYAKANRQDLVAKEEAELAIVLEYMPHQMSREEIMALARQVIGEVGAQGPRDKGKVMSRIMPEVKGKAEGRVVNEVVNQLLDESS